jgi:hypothetical protein
MTISATREVTPDNHEGKMESKRTARSDRSADKDLTCAAAITNIILIDMSRIKTGRHPCHGVVQNKPSS